MEGELSERNPDPVVADPKALAERLAGEWGRAHVAPSPLPKADRPQFALAWLRDHEEIVELCVQPRDGKLQVFSISTGAAGGLLRSAAEVVTRHRR